MKAVKITTQNITYYKDTAIPGSNSLTDYCTIVGSNRTKVTNCDQISYLTDGSIDTQYEDTAGDYTSHYVTSLSDFNDGSKSWIKLYFNNPTSLWDITLITPATTVVSSATDSVTYIIAGSNNDSTWTQITTVTGSLPYGTTTNVYADVRDTNKYNIIGIGVSDSSRSITAYTSSKYGISPTAYHRIGIKLRELGFNGVMAVSSTSNDYTSTVTTVSYTIKLPKTNNIYYGVNI